MPLLDSAISVGRCREVTDAPPTTDHQRFGLPHELQSIYIVMDAKYVGLYIIWSLKVCFSCWKLPRTHKIRMREFGRLLEFFSALGSQILLCAPLDNSHPVCNGKYEPAGRRGTRPCFNDIEIELSPQTLTSTSSDTERFAIRPTHTHVASFVCSFHNNQGVKMVEQTFSSFPRHPGCVY